MRVLITGGAGFIGSAVCRHLVLGGYEKVVNVDKLSYAGNLSSLKAVSGLSNYRFYHADITNSHAMLEILRNERIELVMHLAAESHVDRSIGAPDVFIETNVVGTSRLLNATLEYWRSLKGKASYAFRFHHVSTDEVFGDLPFDESKFSERTPYAPSSPYSASKAASDHLVRAWGHTYHLPVVISNCSNNYGPFHYPEKLIPLVILNALGEKKIPVYGRGENVRDWLFVEDHVSALELVMTKGVMGESYNIGGGCERTNLEVIEYICKVMDDVRPRPLGEPHRNLLNFVSDRQGHDRRYAIDFSKISVDLGWCPKEKFESGISKTIDWYLHNEWWWRDLWSELNDD